MQVQLITLLLGLCLSANVIASDEKEATTLFKQYSKVMDLHKTDLIDEVFTAKYIKNAGGKKELIEKIKELPILKSADITPPEVKVQQGVKSPDIVFAKVKEKTSQKGKKETYSHSDFILVRENGKLKIDGTISDGE